MLRCNNCGRIHQNRNELPLIVSRSQLIDGEWYTTDQWVLMDDEYELENTDTINEEIVRGCGGCTCDDFLEDIDKDSKGLDDEQVYQIWELFNQDTSLVGEDEKLCEDWFGFHEGTSKLKILEWFDKHHSKGIEYLNDLR